MYLVVEGPLVIDMIYFLLWTAVYVGVVVARSMLQVARVLASVWRLCGRSHRFRRYIAMLGMKFHASPTHWACAVFDVRAGGYLGARG